MTDIANTYDSEALLRELSFPVPQQQDGIPQESSLNTKYGHHALQILQRYVHHLVGICECLPESTFGSEHRDLRETAGQLLGLVNRLRMLLECTCRADTLSVSKCSLKPFLDLLLSLIRPRAHENHLQFEFRTAPGLPEAIQTHPRGLRTTLLMILENAVIFTESGFVRLSVDSFEHLGISYLLFTVDDSGRGFPSSAIPVVTEPFVTGESGSHQRCGLGLTIAAGWSKRLGGVLTLKNNPWGGARVQLAIPRDTHSSEYQALPAASDLNRAIDRITPCDRNSMETRIV